MLLLFRFFHTQINIFSEKFACCMSGQDSCYNHDMNYTDRKEMHFISTHVKYHTSKYRWLTLHTAYEITVLNFS